MEKVNIAALEALLGHHFQRPDLLHRALTHSSRAREQEATSGGKIIDNEQLEFLGDAVLGFVTSEELYRRYPEFEEGHLSKLRAHLVSGRHLVRVARELDLGKYLALGRGEEKSGGRSKAALLVNALEAVVAAMYLDAGLEKARELILQRILLPELRELPGGATVPITDYKSTLQELVHTTGHAQPSYVLVKEEGPEHKKTFTVEARLHKGGSDHHPEFVARAAGSTKKRAEQEAARQALEYLGSLAAHAAKSKLSEEKSQ
jgi:ribonuclease-3